MYAIERNGEWQLVTDLRVLGNTFNPTHEQMIAAGYKEVVCDDTEEVIVDYQFNRVEGDTAYFTPVTKSAEQLEQERIESLCEPWVRAMVADMLVMLNEYAIELPVESILTAIGEITMKAEAGGSPYDVVKISAMYTTLRLNGITDIDIPLLAEYIAGGV